MNTTLIIGSILVSLALIAYSSGIIVEQIKKKVSVKVLVPLSLGLSFDIAGTCCMIIGSSNTPFTLHGFIGYSALLAMLIDTSLLWRLKLKIGEQTVVPKALHIYSLLSYLLWIIVYISGTYMAIVK
jgi:uncharacterized repeat protein (TIGR03987 family)